MITFFETFVRLSIVIAAATFVVVVFRIPLRRLAGARVAYLSWGLIPLATVIFGISNVIPTAPLSIALPLTIPTQTILATTKHSEIMPWLDVPQLLLAAWIIGMGFSTAIFASRQHRFTRSLGVLVAECSIASSTPIVRAANEVAGPLALGFIRPRIVIPCDFNERYTEAERALVIAHELAHIRGGDLFVNALAVILQIVFWFNPLLHWAASRMRFDQELACDARVLRGSFGATDQTKDYVAAVLKTVLPQQASTLACHWHSRHPLNERIIAMTTPKPKVLVRRGAQLVLTSIIFGSCYGALAIANRESPPKAGQYRVDLEYTGVSAGVANTNGQPTKSYSLVLTANSVETIKVGNNEVCSFSFSITPIEDDKVSMPFSLNCSEAGNSSAKLSTKLGARSTIRREIEDSGGKRNSHTFSFVVTGPPKETN